MMKSLVTTKKGDAGQTSALDGSLLDKDHPMMEAVGALDAMRAHIALLRVQLQEQRPGEAHEIEFLLFLLHSCFVIGSALSDPHGRKPEWHPTVLTRTHLERLEKHQADLESRLELPRSFMACSTNALAAQADVVTTTVRTFERRFVSFQNDTPDFDGTLYGAYINRLSDYFFILARYLEQGCHLPVNYDIMRPPLAADSGSGRTDTH